jgi:MYND finger
MPVNKKKTSAKKSAGGKKKAAPPSQAAVTCAQCARPIKKTALAIPCICTRVVFCSLECQELAFSSSSPSSSSSSSGLHASSCPGPPNDDVIDMGQQMREREEGTTGWRMGGSDGQTMVHSDADYQRRWKEEHCRDIKDPIAAVLLQQVLLHNWTPSFDPSNPDMSTDEYAKFADQGHACFAYLAGVRYKNRILGKMKTGDRRFTAENKGYASSASGILTTDQLAFKYLLQASEAGIGLAMQSLSECYEKGQGVRKSMLECREWLWHATLLDSAGAREMMDGRFILPIEYGAQSGILEQISQEVSPGQPIQLSGPNLASLMLVMNKELEAMEYRVPAFAGPIPTLTAGNPPRRGTDFASINTTTTTTTAPAFVQLIGINELQQVASLVAFCEHKGHAVRFNYGRRGVSKEATVQTYGPAERGIDNTLFRVPPLPACDERLEPDQVARWIAHAKEAELPEMFASLSFMNPRALKVHCVHAKNNEGLLACQQCIDDACERLAAVSTGSVVLSIEEPLDCRGHVAIWRCKSAAMGDKGVFKSETFKAYGRGEVECLLASLVACGAKCFDAKVAHPLFVAQDPNFFWPLIYNHGSIRAALEYVAPHVDWNVELGPIRAPLPDAGFGILKPSDESANDDDEDQPEIFAGDLLRACGNDLCLNLEPNRSKGSFSICAKCERRSYCSPACQQADWPWHKRECLAASSGRIPAQQDPLAASNSARRQGHQLYFSPPTVNEEVVVHGLVAKPEYNGRLGIITGDMSAGRYPVKLPNHPSTLAVKPSNFHRLGVHVHASSKSEKKTSRFRCAEHGNEVCVPCCLDFSIVNHLCKLHAGNIATGSLTKEAIEKISEMHFATITRADEDRETVFDKNFPMECQGLVDSEKRVVLKALLESSQPRSIHSVAAIAGLTCFGARAEVVSRPYAVMHLKELVDMWQ